MRIFVDVYLAFNLGDDLFLDILAKRYPDARFTVNHVGSNYDAFLTAYPNVKRRRYPLIHKLGRRLGLSDYLGDYGLAAEEHDALVFIGGSIFRDEPYHRALYTERMRMVKAFRDRGLPVYVIGANFGPVRSQAFVQDYEHFFAQCEDVCFRDRHSYAYFRHLPQVRCAPDVVFQLDAGGNRLEARRDRVGYSIIDVRHKHGLADYNVAYKAQTIASIERLTSQGTECWLLSFCEQEGDLSVANEILKGIKPELRSRVHLYAYEGNLEEALRLMGTFRLMIAARFHANIIALLQGTGVLPVIYSEKTVNMLQDLGMGKLIVEMDRLAMLSDESVLAAAQSNTMPLADTARRAEAQFGGLDKLVGKQAVTTA